jgi:DNA-directed RNA polymerase sigma subunit (sigma70/sigma32)
MGVPRLTPNALSHAERAALVESCRGMACGIARRFLGMGVHWDDLEGAALHGLVIAATYFRPELGWKFTTYSTRWVFQSCQAEAERHRKAGFHWIPPTARPLAVQPTDPDGLAVPFGSAMADVYADDPCHAAGSWDTWARLVGLLTPRERRIVELRFRDELTLKQVGRRLGVTRERVRQLEVRLLNRLRRAVMHGRVPEVLCEGE